MNKKIIVGIIAAAMLLTVLVASVVATEWSDYVPNESPEKIEFTTNDAGEVVENTLNYALFEQYGPLLLILALLMFGAMIGGVCIAREEVDGDDTN